MSPWVVQFVVLGNTIKDLVAAIDKDYQVPKYQTILVIVFSVILIVGAIIAVIFARRKWKQLSAESETGVDLP